MENEGHTYENLPEEKLNQLPRPSIGSGLFIDEQFLAATFADNGDTAEQLVKLSEFFTGRTAERRRLKDYLLRGAGILMVWGTPGMGKSAILAQVLHEARVGIAPQDTNGTGGGTEYPPIIAHFIRRGYQSESVEVFFRHLNHRLDEIYGLTGIPIGGRVDEQREYLHRRLDAVSNLKNPKRIVVCVDGLDENPAIARYIPEPREWLVVIISSRPVQTIGQWWAEYYSSGHKEEFELEQLSVRDIRAILFQSLDKYDERVTDTYLTEVASRSQGNPNYLRLLDDRNGAEIPKTLSDMYSSTVERLIERGTDRNAYNLLILLAVAKSSLPLPAIQEFLDLANQQQARAAVYAVQKLLLEDPAPSNEHRFQLYHESLREWLAGTKTTDFRKMESRLIDFCLAYSERKNDEAKRYALLYGAAHLRDVGDKERLWQLMRDEEYRLQQVNTLNRYQPAMDAISHALELYVDQGGKDEQDDPRMCWIVLRAGELGHQATSDIAPAFEIMRTAPIDDPERVARALQRLELVDEGKFFLVCILLLWIEVDRQREIPKNGRKPEYAVQILDAVEKKVPKAAEETDVASLILPDLFWPKFPSPEFLAWWFERILDVFPYETIPQISRIGRRLFDHKTLKVISIFKNNKRESVQELAQQLADNIDLESIRESEDEPGVAAERGETEQAEADLDQALEDAESIEEANDRARALSKVADALTQANESARAKVVCTSVLEVTEKIERPDDQAGSFRTIAETLAQLGETEDAKALFERALTLPEQIESREHKAHVIETIAIRLAQGKQYEKAMAVAEHIEDEDIKARALKNLSNALAPVQHYEKAIEDADRIADDNDKIRAFSAITTILIRSGEKEKAETVVDQELAIVENSDLDSISVKRGVVALVNDLAQLKRYDKAIDVAEQIEDLRFKARALNAIAIQLLKEQEKKRAETVFAQAMASAQELEYVPERVEVLSEMSQELTQAGEKQKALSLANQALENSESIEDTTEQAMVLSDVARALALAGAEEQAVPIFERALEVANSIENENDPASALKTIMDNLLAVGYYSLIEQYIQELSTVDAVWRLFLPEWQELLARRSSAPIGFFRNSFLYYPFDILTSYSSIYLFLSHIIECNKISSFYNIIEECPQLELGFLLEASYRDE